MGSRYTIGDVHTELRSFLGAAVETNLLTQEQANRVTVQQGENTYGIPWALSIRDENGALYSIPRIDSVLGWTAGEAATALRCLASGLRCAHGIATRNNGSL